MVTRLTRYKAAAIQYEPKIHEKTENVRHQLRMTTEAARNGAKLIVLPEMSQVGYCYYTREEIRPYVEPIPGLTTDKYAEIARRYGTYVVVALAEVDPETDNYYNAQALLGPEGLLGKYRKVHSYISESKWAKDGDLGFPVYDTEVGRLGMLICMDQHFFESSRVLALRGMEVLCFSTAWLDERGPAPVWMTRAFENGVYAVCADRWGLERGVQFTGGSCILNPDGSIQSIKDSGNGIVYGEIDLAMARDKKFPTGDERFTDRRPEQYMRIAQNTYLWNPLKFFGLYKRHPLPVGRKSLVTVAQFKPERLAQEDNLDKIAKIALKSAKLGTDLLVLPELATTGAVFRSKDEARSAAETADGAVVKTLVSMAKRNKVFLVTSIVEQDDGRLYNTALLLGKAGLVGKYRKVHLSHLDRPWASPGNLGFPTFDVPVGRVGLAIGHDSMVPENFRCLAADGADIICAPSAVEFPVPIASEGTLVPHPKPIPTQADPLHWHLWRVRAGENCTYVAFANQFGTESGVTFIGRSGIFQPDLFAYPRKETVASSQGEAILSLKIDTMNLKSEQPTNPVRAKYLLRMRQPYWYDPVVMRHLTETDDIKLLSKTPTIIR